MNMGNIPADQRLIVALDVDSRSEAMRIVESLGDTVCFYKVGLQLFLDAGMPVVKELIKNGKRVFLDLKIDDTPRTVEAAVSHVTINDDVQFFTLQGNGDTARAARKGRGANGYPKFLQVTYLSSWDLDDFREHMGLPANVPIPSFDEIIEGRTNRILQSGCEGVIASGTSVGRLRDSFPSAIIVTPGIRPAGTETHDHKRSLTPYDAIKHGANYLVVGRPIRLSMARKDTAKSIIHDIQRALADFPERQGDLCMETATN